MTQELIDLRNSILEQRYSDALSLVDELEGMSKKLEDIIEKAIADASEEVFNGAYNQF